MVFAVSPFAVMVIACWLGCVLLEGGFLVFDSEPVGRLLKPLLARRLGRSRFAQMLARHGVPPSAYLDRSTANAIRSELTRCEACAEKRQCDAALAQEHPVEDRVNFCSNRAALERLSSEAHES